MRNMLHVRVNDELVLDAGTCEMASATRRSRNGADRLFAFHARCTLTTRWTRA